MRAEGLEPASGEPPFASPVSHVYRTAAEDPAVLADVELSVTADRIRAAYRLSSKVPVELIVHDVVTVRDENGDLLWDRFLAYVSFEEPATLALLRVIPSPPTWRGGFIAPQHLWRPLPGFKTLDGTIVVDLPAKEYNPWYRPSGQSVYRKATASRLKLVLEYQYPVPKGVPAEPKRIEAAVDLEEPLPVKRRSDIFEPV